MTQEQANWEWMDARVKRLESYLEAYKTRVAELEKDLEGCEYFLNKQQSAEPVAWMHKESGQVFAGMGSPMKPNDFTPLYTTPQIKELSDEEITNLGREYIDIEWFDEGEYGMEYNIYGIVDFARAILKKASEK